MISLIRNSSVVKYLWAWMDCSVDRGVSRRSPARSKRLALECDSDSNGDERRVADVLAGRSDAQEALIRDLTPGVFTLARAISGTIHNPAAVAEAMFLQIFGSLKCHRPDAPLSDWSARIAVEAGLRWVRNEERSETVCRWSTDDTKLLQSLAIDDSDVPPPQTPEAAGLFVRLLDCLPPAQRFVKTLLDLEDHAIEDICRLTGWSTAKTIRIARSADQSVDRLLGKIGSNDYEPAS
jgi:DNA-directed RNA polymerase specialized sigma24 family protein